MSKDAAGGELREYEIVQPSLRREWHLRRGGDLVAMLHLPVFRRGASAKAGEESWRIEREHGSHGGYVIHDEQRDTELARLRADGRRKVLELSDRSGEWRRLNGGAVGAVALDGTVLLSLNFRPGFLRSRGAVQVNSALGERDATAAMLLAVCAALRKGDEYAAAAAVPSILGA